MARLPQTLHPNDRRTIPDGAASKVRVRVRVRIRVRYAAIWIGQITANTSSR